MINVSNSIKEAFDKSTTQVDKIIVDGQEYIITNVEYYDDCYNDGNIYGTTIARCLDFEIENVVNLEKKEVEYVTGIKINQTINWISLGKFIVQEVEPNDTNNINKVSAMDYMLKTNQIYNTELNYSNGTITLLNVLQECCSKCGLILATTDFPNKNFIVDSNQFTEDTLYRQVIQAVAQISGTVAKIKNNNQLYLINPNNVTSISKVFTLNNYKEIELKRDTHPINVVILGMSNVEGENVTLKDEESIEELGEENNITINDNPFAYTQNKREQLITALFNAIKGFEYKAYSLKCQGLPYLETLDKIQIMDKEINTYNSFIFRFNYKSPKGLESTIEAPSIIKATVNYQNVVDALEISKRTEILVDKQNQTIESVVSDVSDQNTKISVLTQKVGELESQISDVADLTVTAETMNASVDLDNINESEPIFVKIRPITTNISYLYPRNDLYPSNDLYMPIRTLRFKNTTTDEIFDYELPDNLLYYDSENYDEFTLDYENQLITVVKKCKYNTDGTVGLLNTPVATNYPYPRINLTAGDYTVELLTYDSAYLLVRLMVSNLYTDQFATKTELNSKLTQTAEEITASVNQTLTNYATTEEMNSAISISADNISSSVSMNYSTKVETDFAKNEAINSANNSTDAKLEQYPTTVQMNTAINQSADSITSTVSQTYETKTDANNTFATKTQLNTAKTEIKQTTDSIESTVSTKVGNNEIISKINQSSESVTIDSDRISLNRKNNKYDK